MFANINIMARISNLELIKFLEKNSRATFAELARVFNVSETAIRKRLMKLEKDGVIRRYTVEVDPKKIGFEVDALIGIDTTPEQFIPIIEKLKETPEVRSLYTSTGDHMILIRSWFKNSDELRKFLKKIKEIPGITKICPAIILEKIK